MQIQILDLYTNNLKGGCVGLDIKTIHNINICFLDVKKKSVR